MPNINETSFEKLIQPPLISVVITTYNRPYLLKRALHSALIQTYPNFEAIVVDDASTVCNVAELLNSEFGKDTRYRVITNPKNVGLAATRNIGLHNANGEYIAFLDDDDEWLPKRLEIQIAGIDENDIKCTVYYCGKKVNRSDGSTIDMIQNRRGDLMEALLERFTPPPSTLFFRRTALLSVGGFDEKLTSCIDHDIWFKMANAGFTFSGVPYALVLCNPVNHNGERMTTNPQKRMKGLGEFLEKWHSVIEQKCGPSGYASFRRWYYAGSWMILAQASGGKYAYIFRIIRFVRALIYDPVNLRAWAFLLASIIMGQKGIPTIVYIIKTWIKR
jgi:glycosyltransferase involved in cell wall biosynthesis